MVGFSDPKYFRTCFKKQFGTLPSEYVKKSFRKAFELNFKIG